MKKMLALVYGIAAYGLFLGTFLYAIGFVGNLGVPTSLDSPASGPRLRSCLIDLGLLSLFALQHSGMARERFKKGWTRLLPPSLERSVYAALSGLFLLLLPATALAGRPRRGLDHRFGINVDHARLQLLGDGRELIGKLLWRGHRQRRRIRGRALLFLS